MDNLLEAISSMRFSTFGGRAGIYARVTAQRLRGLSALVKTEAAFMRWLLSDSLKSEPVVRFEFSRFDTLQGPISNSSLS